MDITVGWCDKSQSVMHMDFAGHWDSGDSSQALRQLQRLLGEVNTPCAPIVIVFNVRYYDPPPVSVLTIVRAVLGVARSHAKTFVIISDDLLLNSIVHLLETFYDYFGVKIIVAESTEVAKAYIADTRAARA